MSLHNLAKTVRTAGESQDLELANFDKAQVVTFITAAFGEPIEASEYLRVTLVVGGGKKVRQKFREQLPKEVIEALRDIGYTEDRAASACPECQGSYKYQHDTDKDLKFVHVFPKVNITVPAADDDAVEEEVRIAGLRVEEMPPELLCAMCSLDVFVGMTGSKCPLFSQRRALFKRLRDVQARLKEMEEKMARMESISKEDNELYERTVDLQAKLDSLTHDMEAMIDQGHLTKAEIKELVTESKEKLEALDEKIGALAKEGKKTTKLEAPRQALVARLERLEQATPIVYRKPHEQDILALRKRLRALEAKAASPKATLDDVVRLSTARPNIEEDIARLEDEDRGWFEECVPKEERPPAQPRVAPAPAAASHSSGGSWAGWQTVGSKSTARKGR